MLVGFNTNDDAGVYLFNDDLALVQTVDFFTPIVDDPFTFGQIAAANSLSDVYAMGGKPVSALSIVGFPDKGDPAILEQIIRGGLDKMKEAGCTVIGGHSIRNDDIQFGYAVTGSIHPKKIWKNVGAQTNDVILLTKPLGTGIISTALKRERAGKASVDASIASMAQLNRSAAEALHELQHKSPGSIHAVTDVTGFGLLGHAREMALGEPQKGTPAALDAARQGMIPGGLNNNRDFITDCVHFADSVPEECRALLFDPQTSGGLLVALAPDAAETALQFLAKKEIAAHKIGRVLPKSRALLSVL